MMGRLLGRSTHATVLVGRSGEWVLDRRLGVSRASAEVWEAYLLGDERRRVAVKLAANEEGSRLLRRELERLTDLDPGEHIVEVVDAAEPDGAISWLATKLAARGSLLDHYSARPLRPLVELLLFVSQAVQGLMDAEVVHRDLHPGNLLLYGNGRGANVRVAGWGRSIVHGVPQPAELAPAIADFASAQVLDERCDADIRDDLFSLGAIVWWGCSGQAPTGARRSGAADRAQTPPDGLEALIGDVPSSVADVLTRLLQPSRERRSPAFGGRTEYLRWLRDEIESGLEDVRYAELRIGRPIEVGPGAVAVDSRFARVPRPGASASRRLAPAPARSPAFTGPSERKGVSERMSSGALVVAAGESEHPSLPAVTTRLEDKHGVFSTHLPRLPYPPRITRWLLGALVAFHLVVGLLLLHPQGTLGTTVGALSILLATGGILWMDTAIVERLGLSGGRLTLASFSTGGLLVVRSAIGLAIALLASQALMSQVFAPELEAPSAAERTRQRIDLAAMQTVLARLERSIASEPNAASGAGRGEPSQSENSRLAGSSSTAEEARVAATAQASRLAEAKLRERRARLVRETSDAATALTQASAAQLGRTSGGRYVLLRDEPQILALYLLVFLTVVLLEVTPIAMSQAKLSGGRRTPSS